MLAEEQQQQQSLALTRCEKQLGYTEESKGSKMCSIGPGWGYARSCFAGQIFLDVSTSFEVGFASFIFRQYSGREEISSLTRSRRAATTPMTY
jgi:hypothetical protein